MKKCFKCGETKPLTGFHKNAGRPDGVQTQCKACNAAYRASNVVKINAYSAHYRIENLEKLRLDSAEYRAAFPDKAKATSAASRAAHPEISRTSGRNRRARKRKAGGQLSVGWAAKLLTLQRGKCACCGEPLGKDCHLDHIMPLALGGANTDNNTQLLRATCNMQKQAKHPVDFMQQRGFLL